MSQNLMYLPHVSLVLKRLTSVFFLILSPRHQTSLVLRLDGNDGKHPFPQNPQHETTGPRHFQSVVTRLHHPSSVKCFQGCPHGSVLLLFKGVPTFQPLFRHSQFVTVHTEPTLRVTIPHVFRIKEFNVLGFERFTPQSHSENT